MLSEDEIFNEKALAEVRSRIGVIFRKGQPFNEVATRDAIRHFAQGYGDTNPLYCNDEYSRKTQWGGIIAPPLFLFSCYSNQTSGASVGLPGAHALWTGDEWEFFQPVRENDRITDSFTLKSVEEVRGSFANKLYAQTVESTFRNQRGELVARELMTNWRFTRYPSENEKRDRYSDIGRASYNKEQIDAIYDEVLNEPARGAIPRYWDDVQIGEAVPAVVKGPLTVTDIIAFKIGMGHFPFVRAHKIRFDYERRHPASVAPNAQGIPDVPERVHWEDELAQTIGIPFAFDFGFQRVSFVSQVITNWMGDDGFLRKLRAKIRRPYFVGDTVWFRGSVTNKYVVDGEHLVECELWGDDQRGRRTTEGSAVVRLPFKKT